MAQNKQAMQMKMEFQREVEQLQKLQNDLKKMNENRTKAIQQQHENELVSQELELLDEDSNVYKLIGPALVKQDLLEAKTTIQKRLDYIKAELDRQTATQKQLETKVIDKQQKIMKLQNAVKAQG